MTKPSERKLGVVPEWTKTGPIDRKNYSYRAEVYAAQKSAERQGLHPTITRETAREWVDYWKNHLGGLPFCARLLMEGSVKELTVPELHPQWFDATYAPLIPRAVELGEAR